MLALNRDRDVEIVSDGVSGYAGTIWRLRYQKVNLNVNDVVCDSDVVA